MQTPQQELWPPEGARTHLHVSDLVWRALHESVGFRRHAGMVDVRKAPA